MKILPSIASADPLNYEKQIEALGAAESLHFDIEDGNFIPNITFGMKTIRSILQNRNICADAHLMVTNPYNYIENLAECGIKKIAVHYEAVPYPKDILNFIRSRGMKAGIALNFKTSAKDVRVFADALDYVLVMTAEPDWGSQKFDPVILDKIYALRKLLPQEVEIWADGDITPDALPLLKKSGADTAVMGRAIWESRDPGEAYRKFSRIDG